MFERENRSSLKNRDILVLQKKALHILHTPKLMDHFKSLFQALYICQFFITVKENLGELVTNSNVHSKNTRNKYNIHVKVCQTRF